MEQRFVSTIRENKDLRTYNIYTPKEFIIRKLLEQMFATNGPLVKRLIDSESYNVTRFRFIEQDNYYDIDYSIVADTSLAQTRSVIIPLDEDPLFMALPKVISQYPTKELRKELTKRLVRKLQHWFDEFERLQGF